MEVTFTDTSTNSPTSWTWEKNDGGGWVPFDGTPNDQNPTEDFGVGTWSVRLTACNLNGCNVHTEPDIVVAAVTPVAEFSGTPLSGCAPLEVAFTDESLNNPTSWLWEKDEDGNWVEFDGTPNAQNPVEIFAEGTRGVRLTVENACGSDVEEKNDYVEAAVAPVAAFSGTPLSGTAPLEVVFTDESTGEVDTWLWEKNDGGGWVPFDGTPGEQNPTEEFATGTWSVRLTVTNVCDSDTHTRTDYVMVDTFITATGGTVTEDGDFKVHTFTADGDFEILTGSGDIEVLIVAGGGSGGNAATNAVGAGGGGGGGIIHDMAFPVSPGIYACVVGAGGNPTIPVQANGRVSTVDPHDTAIVTALGGGEGGTPPPLGGGVGGGGGSGGGSACPTLVGGVGSQGEDGGGGSCDAPNFGGGGGGGGGAPGVAGTDLTGGDAGDGLSISITGAAVDYSGGGGGGTFDGGTAGVGGAGGGGAGSSSTGSGVDGTANTGGGGGGAGADADTGGQGGFGGSGIIIFRYQFQ